ncbi:MAG TPA: hypothetical protein VMW04_03035 [Patescibacteria group bacterium]|nr:hypothetical protein [Patescibacteria group bacterium]
MKKLVFLLIFPALLFLTAGSARAQNKVGVNIGDHWQEFDQAAGLVGPGGWVVVMACPGDGDKIAKIVSDPKYQNINLVIRGHYPEKTPDENQARAWTATLQGIPFPNKVYFMPWNEPNHQNEGGGETEGNRVYQYSQFLKNLFQEAGILGSKVILLSPMVDKLNPSFINGSFFTNPGGKAGFYGLFAGSSINEYDQFVNGPCSAIPPMNNCRYDEIGIPSPYYALETGVAGTCTPPCYRDEEIGQMLEKVWPKWAGDSSFKMFAVFSYDPHRPGSWSIFGSAKTASFLKSHRGGGDTQRITPSATTPTLNRCPGKQHAYYVTSSSECNECGSGDEPMILAVKDNLICTDFSLNKGSETSQYTPATLPPGQQQRVLAAGSGQSAEGSLTLQKEAVPNFSVMEQNLYLGLNRLLPQALRQNLNLDSTPLKTKLKHYVVDKEDLGPASKPSKIPETGVTLPSWWTRLLGSTKIACGLFNACEPPPKMAIKVAANVPEPPGWEITCQSGNPAEDNPVNQLATLQSNFSTPASFITKVLEPILKLIDNIWQWVTVTQTKVALINKSRGKLPGGETFNEQSTYLNHAIPEAIKPSNKDEPLAGEAEFKVEGYQVGVGSSALNYQQEAARKRYCLERCALRPQGIDIQSFDPLCPTCSF